MTKPINWHHLDSQLVPQHPDAETLALYRDRALAKTKAAHKAMADIDGYTDTGMSRFDGVILDMLNAQGDYTIARHRWSDDHGC